MWTQAQRATYKQSGTALPSDLPDAQWERLKPLIPAAKSGGRARKTDMRAAMNATFYLLRTGCPWRYVPRGPFPPRSTIYNIFRQFQREGAWERICEELHMALRETLGRDASPTAAIIDSQSLKAAENVWPAPSASGFLVLGLICLHKRIRPSGEPLAKMESRASWSL
jgi:transposase